MTPAPDPARCAICGKPQADAYKPFCSKRCADIDLSRWLKGVYAIPATAQEETEEPPPAESGED